MDWKQRSETYDKSSWVNNDELLYECIKNIENYL